MVETGLIIAAGAGTRLLAGKGSVPKPLCTVCGIPLLKRIILSAHRGGLKKIHIVLGYQKEKIIDYINGQSWPVEINFIHNDEWKRANGISVLKAREQIRENFVLLMSDHIFDPRTLASLRTQPLNDHAVKLAVDFKVHQLFDKDDATKVFVKDGHIVAIDKNLVRYNAVDTGMFLMSPEIFVALSSAIKDGDCSLSDGVRSLALQGKASVLDVKEGYWQDIDTIAALRHAEKMLVKACRKSTDGFVSRHFNRHISGFLSFYLVKTPISANAVTFLVTAVGLTSGYYAARGGYASYLFAAFLFKLASILDGVDGEMANLTFTNTRLGQFLDTIGDNLTYFVFILGTGLGLFRQGYAHRWILAVFALFGVSVLIALMFLYLFKFSSSGSFLAVQKELVGKPDLPLFSKIFTKIYFVIKRDFFALLFLLLAILGKPQWVLFLVAVATNIAWMVIVQTKFLKKKGV